MPQKNNIFGSVAEVEAEPNFEKGTMFNIHKVDTLAIKTIITGLRLYLRHTTPLVCTRRVKCHGKAAMEKTVQLELKSAYRLLVSQSPSTL